jgi:hypothetical protein
MNPPEERPYVPRVTQPAALRRESNLRVKPQLAGVTFGSSLTGVAVSPNASADLFIRAGDTSPIFTDTILDPSGHTVANLSTVTLVLRSLQSAAPVTLTGTASIVSGSSVQYVWASTDTITAGPGLYNAEWDCVLSDGSTYTYPNNGYRTISIEQPLTTAPEELVSIADAKEYANIPSEDTTQDEKLLRFIRSLRPVVEHITGPIIPQQFEEWHDGGNTWIKLLHSPRTGMGTSPILTVLACSEYLGPIEWPLSIITSPDQGQLYSCMVEIRRGRVVRRTAGGGVQAFACQGPQSVHVIYESGQSVVPDNVYEATLELIRNNFQSTQQANRSPGPYPSSGGGGDEQGPRGLIWGRASKLLAPTRRFPSIA